MPELSSVTERSTADAFRAANLRQRVITAVVIGVGFLALVLYSSPLWFAIISGAVFLIAAWEWCDLAGLKNRYMQVSYQFILMALILFFIRTMSEAGIILLALRSTIWALIFWCAVLYLIVTYPDSSKFLTNTNVNTFVTFILIQPVWLSLYFLKTQQPGGMLILLVIAMIAMADIGAYFAGVRFGKHKLAPKVSPGKSWEGVAGGVLLNLVFVAGLSQYLHWAMMQTVKLALIAVAVTAASIVGDLFESMVKRHRGVKDSGTILPGHGGILDRIDGWLAAVPVFTLAYLCGWTGLSV